MSVIQGETWTASEPVEPTGIEDGLDAGTVDLQTT